MSTPTPGAARSRAARRPALATAVAAAACAGPQQLAPKQRYVAALKRKHAGDAQGYFDDLLALAHDAPETRAGRRARAVVASGGLVSEVAMWAAVASVVLGGGAVAGDGVRRLLEDLAQRRNDF